jgi:hypothetical protein
MKVEQQQFRVEWCKRHLENKTDFRNWVFSDEKWFFLVCKKKNEWVWLPVPSTPLPPRPSPPPPHP